MNASIAAKRSVRSVSPRDVFPVSAQDLPVVRAHNVTNALYGARGLRLDGLLWYWQHGWPSRIQEWVTLAADDLRLQLALDGDAIGFATRELDWRNYEDETRLLAWTACHEPLIALLRAMFQCDWVPESLGDCDAAPREECVRAGFSIHRADGTPVVSGVTLLDTDCVQRLATSSSFTQPKLHHPLRGVRAHLPIVLDEFEIARAEISAITPGAIVRLDNRSLAGGASRVSIAAGRVRLIADVSEATARVVGAAAPASAPNHQGHSMNSNPAMPGECADNGISIDTLPVKLSFSAGALSVPFSTLADIGPGFVFELEKRLDDQAILIHANDVPIAHGELVVIGDLVGVRITRMLSKA